MLLVEDEPEVRAVVRSFLLALGCRVTEFASAEPALASLDAGCRHDLLLTDIALGPGLRGTELARRTQARFPGVAVLLMSGYSVEMLHGEGDAALPWELLRKPYERADLARGIQRALAARGDASREV